MYHPTGHAHGAFPCACCPLACPFQHDLQLAQCYESARTQQPQACCQLTRPGPAPHHVSAAPCVQLSKPATLKAVAHCIKAWQDSPTVIEPACYALGVLWEAAPGTAVAEEQNLVILLRRLAGRAPAGPMAHPNGCGAACLPLANALDKFAHAAALNDSATKNSSLPKDTLGLLEQPQLGPRAVYGAASLACVLLRSGDEAMWKLFEGLAARLAVAAVRLLSHGGSGGGTPVDDQVAQAAASLVGLLVCPNWGSKTAVVPGAAGG